MAVRPCVVAFAEAMERGLWEYDHKGGWDDVAGRLLFYRLDQALKQFKKAYADDAPAEQLLSEAADVANFLMMICDVSGVLAVPRDTPTQLELEVGG